MKKKKLKDLAERIATLELALMNATSRHEKEQIEREIMFLSEDDSLTADDYFMLDELILMKFEKLKVGGRIS